MSVGEGIEITEKHIKELAQEIELEMSRAAGQLPYFWCILAFIVFVLGSMGIRKVLFATLFKLSSSTKTNVDDFISIMTHAFTKPLMLVVASAFAATTIYPLTAPINNFAKLTFTVVAVFKGLSAVMKVIGFVLENDLIIDDDKDGETKNMVHNLQKAVKVILWFAGTLFILDNAGFDITSIIAGLGIGGIAIALATQAVLADAFNSFVILIDKPFKVGDCICVNGVTGFVEHIGFKTSRIRALTGEMVVFSNSTMTGSVVQNFKQATVQNRDLIVGIDNDTSNEKVREWPKAVFAAIDQIDKVTAVQVYFKEYGTYTLNFHVRYQVASTSPDVLRDCLGEINTVINETARKVGISFPYPTTRLRMHPQHLDTPLTFNVGS
eukprot:TRINITY_DN3299_c0_g2_i3.p1 TRINITY_DN3299_c0_g2~~TRINITY_DN3299_c0_g2_i3.p1  ORF type:complete len:381 (-),score=43.85 TRINITY_DN3299_c0_g2_i3:48-1190(-)